MWHLEMKKRDKNKLFRCSFQSRKHEIFSYILKEENQIEKETLKKIPILRLVLGILSKEGLYRQTNSREITRNRTLHIPKGNAKA